MSQSICLAKENFSSVEEFFGSIIQVNWIDLRVLNAFFYYLFLDNTVWRRTLLVSGNFGEFIWLTKRNIKTTLYIQEENLDMN